MVTLPLTSAQLEIWLQLQVTPDRADLYQLACRVNIIGTLDQHIFVQAVLAAIQSTAAFRLRVRGEPNNPRQEIPESSPTHTAVVDLSMDADPDSSLATWLRTQESEPIQLKDETYLRSALLRLAADRWCWYHRHHHIAVDALGIQVFQECVAEQYSRLQNGNPVSLISDIKRYTAHVSEGECYLASEQYKTDNDYWTHTTPLTLTSIARRSTGRPVSALYSSARILCVANNTLSPLLRLSIDNQIPFLQLLSTAAVIFVQCLSQQLELCVGLVVHGRPPLTGKDLVVMSSDVIPVPISINPTKDVSSSLRSIHTQIRHTLTHRRFPSAHIRRLRGTSGYDLASQRGVVINVYPVSGELRFGASVGTSRPMARQYPNDLTVLLYVDRNAHHVKLELSGNGAWHEQWELESYLSSLAHILEHGFTDTSRVLADITQASAEQVNLLMKWARTDGSLARPIHALSAFDFIAKRQPNAVAIREDNRCFTYSELDAKATIFAVALRHIGICRHDFVAVSLERSVDAVVSLLAIFKVGAAYVPLDTTSPVSRLTGLLSECNARALIVRGPIANLSLPSGTLLVTLDDMRSSGISADSCVGTDTAVQPVLDSLAYVIFTSGSTGTPKGVMIEHRTLANYLAWRHEHFQTSTDDVFVQKAPLTFDMSIAEMLVPLTAGATLVLPESGVERDPSRLADTIRASGITCISLIPSMLSNMLPVWHPRCASVRNVYCGGEAVPIETVKAFQSVVQGTCRLHNVYGPTEATLIVSSYTFEDGYQYNFSPIGKPAALAELYVLNDHHKPLPIGCTGQLYVGGDCLAKGYLNNPALTEQSFANIRIEGQLKRLYRTGDFVRWLESGNLEFCGRADHQVKIRGSRIELGEIEKQIRGVPGVLDACVIAHGASMSDRKLVAFVVHTEHSANRSTTELASDCRSWIQGRLPHFMLPHVFIPIETLPRTPNGKIARNSLPLDLIIFESAKDYASPLGFVEIILADIWRPLLGMEMIGRNDDFFEIGGTSLLAISAVAAAQDRLGLEIPVSLLMERPTISELAEWISLSHGLDGIKNGAQLRGFYS